MTRAVLPLLCALGCQPDVKPVLYTDHELLAEMEGYTTWASPALWPNLEPTCDGPHGQYARIYANAVAATALAEGKAELPEGALLVEASFQDTVGTPKLVSAMRKVPGYAPDGGDWYWGQLDEAGALQVGGAIPACATCHAESAGYLRHTDGPPLDTPCDDEPDPETGFIPF